ncbi:Phospholipase C [Raineyella antarctica]|uniref:Phospholipase C n=1 Tax=Raineyella antarctica TaxID=1577474 RepID=A0A1G6I5J2_9ACTN|nr:alkaline phosphatase family protein [Raineyella antarctica]SDC01720.1 Phospholipase C [Raineyella antarctica]
MSDSPVTLFDERQLAGTTVALEEGETRFTGGFNDAASSVHVTDGYCAILYADANEFGGYGASVDLLEDCPDLSVYGFDKETSAVQVFRTERDGFVWARAALRDGQVVPGHWERKRAASSTPLNGPTAVVSPPSPPRTAPASGGGPVVRDHRGEGEGDAIIRDHRSSKIKHVFVLMLENRSFDHMLGFSGITGTDAATGQPTTIEGLTGSESNTYQGTTYAVRRGAPDRAPHDPGHNFTAVLEQLCGEGVTYSSGQAYPPISNSGFVASYAGSHPDLPDGSMYCYSPDQLPVLTALAREFAVCDHWFCSLPGPTEPNRWFVHAATSGDFDESPSTEEYITSHLTPWSGISFASGTIFDKLEDADIPYRIYAGDSFPNVGLLKGISRTFDIDEFDEDFADDVASPDYDAAYTFIEPSYDAFSEFEDGTSQHPLASARAGEMLIKKTYEALRRSPIWESSLLVITYDEHGGFYDHVAPPAARPTGYRGRSSGFTFDRLGPRVPAVIVSPLIPKNLIDHHTYEHSSVAATLVRLFGLGEFTPRTATSSDLKPLARLETPRTDAPMTLPEPAGGSTLARVVPTPLQQAQAKRPDRAIEDDPTGIIGATVMSGLSQHLEVTPESEHEAIIGRVHALQTYGEALEYLKEVDALVRQGRQNAGITRSATVRRRRAMTTSTTPPTTTAAATTPPTATPTAPTMPRDRLLNNVTWRGGGPRRAGG